MFPSRTFLIVLSIIITTPAAFAQIHIVNFDFGAVGVACSYGYAYEGSAVGCTYYPEAVQNFDTSPGFGWTLGGLVTWHSTPPSYGLNGSAGLTVPNSEFSPPPFTGMPFSQAVFLQDRGSFVWQEIGGFTADTYTLSFYLGSRYRGDSYDGNQTVTALIDGIPVGTWALSSYTPFTLETATFTVSTGGNHTVAFMGTRQGDHTAFLSYVVITPTQHHNP